MIYLYLVFNYDLLWPFLYLSWLLRTLYADAGGGPSQECGNGEEGSGDGSPTCIHCGSSSPSVVPAICPTRSDFLA